jgi:hypothetical protein
MFRRPLLALWLFAGACGSTNVQPFLGTYRVMVSGRMQVDTDVLTIDEGSGSTLVLDFTNGITGAPGGDGLHGAATSASTFQLTMQAAAIDQATGPLAGQLIGNGAVDPSGALDLKLSFIAAGAPAEALSITGSRL